MNRSKKMIMAAAIVAAGYGVAALFGRPDQSLPPNAVSPADSARSLPWTSERPSHSVAIGPSTTLASGMRLVPEPLAEPIAITSASGAPPFVATDAARSETKEPNPHKRIDGAGTVSTTQGTTAESSPPLQARLRDEAPRALGPGQGPQLTVASVTQPVAGGTAVELAEPQPFSPSSAVAEVSRPDALPGARASMPHGNWHANAVQASHASLTDPMGSYSQPPAEEIAPLAYPTTVHGEELRSHIVVDGDSLTKLAGRYLNDPHRAPELFEYNRAVLSDPELLPIGVELTIPPRQPPGNIANQSPQSRLPRSVAAYSSPKAGLVPVRPVPARNVVPQAYLTSPRLAE